MLSIFFIGLALSMDAFSLSIGIGTTNINKLQKLLLALTIGLMHFIMSQLGKIIGTQLFDLLFINISILNIVIFTYLGIMMLIKKDKPIKILNLSLINMLILSICVSFDSLTVGLAMEAVTKHTFIASCVFALCSSTISYIGLIVGEGIANLFKEKSKILGGLLLMLIAVVNLFKEIF